MADQIIAVKSGFYNSINHDRLYDADDMCLPYASIVSEGAYPRGYVDTEALAVVADGGMVVEVGVGDGLYHGRWLHNGTVRTFTVPDNNTAYTRIDSVLVQIDMLNRVGNIVYREGTPAANPVPPTISTSGNVFEWRLGNVTVTAGETDLNQSDVEDTRVFAVFDTGTQEGEFTIKSGSPNTFASHLVANGKVVTFFIEAQTSQALVLSFPAGFEPDDCYDGASAQMRFPTFGYANSEYDWVSMTFSGLDDKWHASVPIMSATAGYSCGTYIRK